MHLSKINAAGYNQRNHYIALNANINKKMRIMNNDIFRKWVDSIRGVSFISIIDHQFNYARFCNIKVHKNCSIDVV